MDIQGVTSLITTVGFPIAVCLICFWYIKRQDEKHQNENEKRDEIHKQEIDKLTDALHNNTIVMQKLVDRLGDYNE